MNISPDAGFVEFDNVKLYKGFTEADLPILNQQGQILERLRSESWATYSFLYAQDGPQLYVLSLQFFQGVLQNVAILVGHPNGSWDDETPERIAEDRQLLIALFQRVICHKGTTRTFSWGTVSLAQDYKNAFQTKIHVAYS